MSNSDSSSTQSAKKSSSVNNSTDSKDLLVRANDLYERFVNYQLEHAVTPHQSNFSSSVEFFRNPANQLEAAALVQDGVKLVVPVLKGLLTDPFNVYESRQNIDKREKEK